MITLTMYDAVNPTNLPKGFLPAVSWYKNGFRSKWPAGAITKIHALFKLSISVTPTENADAYDCENGNFAPQQIPTILRKYGRKLIYIGLRTWPMALGIVKRAGLVADWWIADWTNTPHLLPGSVATQWQSKATYDVSCIDLAYLMRYHRKEEQMAITVTQTGSNETNRIVLVEKTGTDGHAYVFSFPLNSISNYKSVRYMDMTDAIAQQATDASKPPTTITVT